mgnify:CR=1 FL=1
MDFTWTLHGLFLHGFNIYLLKCRDLLPDIRQQALDLFLDADEVFLVRLRQIVPSVKGIVDALVDIKKLCIGKRRCFSIRPERMAKFCFASL